MLSAPSPPARLTAAIYAVSVAALFASSALNHRVRWRSPAARRWMRRLDHSSQSQAWLVVLDLRELAFIDGCGVHAIISAGIRARRAGRRLVLVRVPQIVDRMLVLTGSTGQVEIADVDPVAPPVHALQRSLVARSLLMADETPR